MRHRKNFNHLGRKTGHRRSMLANMASSLILHKRIQTTTAKAKALRIYVEPLITKSKDDSTHSRRTVFSHLQNKDAVTELFREVSPKVADRPGGYTRILKTGTRLGDNADMCIIELVDYNENLLSAKDEAAGKSGKRRRRGGKKKTTEATTQTADTSVVEETNTEVSAETVEEQEPVKEETSEAPVEEVQAESEKKVEAVIEKEEAVAEVLEEEKKPEFEEEAETAEPEKEVKAESEEKSEDEPEEKKKEE